MWNGEIRGDDSRRGERPSAASVHHLVKPVERPAGVEVAALPPSLPT
jgi:hypothetical protein